MNEIFEGGFIYKNGVFVPFNSFMSEECEKNFTEGEAYVFIAPDIKDKKKRTWLQNKSMHLWFEKMASWLNESGFTMSFVLSMLRKSTLRWTADSVKELIWRNIQRAKYNKESTTNITTKEVNEIYEDIVLFCLERLKSTEPPPPWPDRYSQSIDENTYR